jgi:hypothetical protein
MRRLGPGSTLTLEPDYPGASPPEGGGGTKPTSPRDGAQPEARKIKPNTPHAVTEYRQALARSVREALTFDPSGRPGAAQVREDQARIKAKQINVQRRTLIALGRDKGGAIRCPHSGRAQYYAWQRQHRQARVDRFLAELSAWKVAADMGCPNTLFHLPLPERGQLGASYSDCEQYADGWWIRKETVEERDWDKYSKSWHRTHGPAVTVTARRVTIARMVNGVPERYVVNLSTWSGDWRARAVVEAGLAPASKIQLAVRLHKAYDAELVATRHGYRIYRRTLLGQPVDWVAVAPLGTTYHHDTRAGAIRGLHDKLRNRELKITGRLIDWAKCRSLGFCETGIKAFCDAVGLSPRGSYVPEEIDRAVRANPDAAAPYLAELRTLAAAVSFSIPEFN